MYDKPILSSVECTSPILGNVVLQGKAAEFFVEKVQNSRIAVIVVATAIGIIVGFIGSYLMLWSHIKSENSKATLRLEEEAEKLANFRQELFAGNLAPTMLLITSEAKEALKGELGSFTSEQIQASVQKLRLELAHNGATNGRQIFLPDDVKVAYFNDYREMNSFINENKGRIDIIDIKMYSRGRYILYRERFAASASASSDVKQTLPEDAEVRTERIRIDAVQNVSHISNGIYPFINSEACIGILVTLLGSGTFGLLGYLFMNY